MSRVILLKEKNSKTFFAGCNKMQNSTQGILGKFIFYQIVMWPM